ncbi:MAG: LacI family DNA-binding transcriptional regulator [Chloroflexota bacterium]
MGRTKRTTLRDVAAAVGFSVNTVSRALTGKDGVGDEVRARVVAEARRLGYTPNILARSLVTGSTKAIGLVITNPSNPLFGELITAIEQLARERGYRLLLATSLDDPQAELESIDSLLQWPVDGLLVVPVGTSREPLAPLRESNVPFVLVYRDIPEADADYVVVDPRLSGYDATAHLLALGHRRIAVLVRDLTVTSISERVAGFRQAMVDAGVAVDESLVLQTPSGPGGHGGPLWSPEGAHDACLRLARLRNRPTAVLATNDYLALGAYSGFAEAGLRIPEDVSIIGCADMFFSRYMVPPLTSLQSQVSELGRAALRLLLDRVERERPPKAAEKIRLRPKLVIRGSTAPPRALAAPNAVALAADGRA